MTKIIAISKIRNIIHVGRHCKSVESTIGQNPQLQLFPLHLRKSSKENPSIVAAKLGFRYCPSDQIGGRSGNGYSRASAIAEIDYGSGTYPRPRGLYRRRWYLFMASQRRPLLQPRPLQGIANHQVPPLPLSINPALDRSIFPFPPKFRNWVSSVSKCIVEHSLKNSSFFFIWYVVLCVITYKPWSI